MPCRAQVASYCGWDAASASFHPSDTSYFGTRGAVYPIQCLVKTSDFCGFLSIPPCSWWFWVSSLYVTARKTFVVKSVCVQFHPQPGCLFVLPAPQCYLFLWSVQLCAPDVEILIADTIANGWPLIIRGEWSHLIKTHVHDQLVHAVQNTKSLFFTDWGNKVSMQQAMFPPKSAGNSNK